MVQLRDGAAQLVKHLNNEDVNKPGGMQKIFDVPERSPLVKPTNMIQHRKRLMSLSRYAGDLWIGWYPGDGREVPRGTPSSKVMRWTTSWTAGTWSSW